MRILTGLELGGHALTAFDDLLPGEGAVADCVLGPGGLLRDLELRLGIGLDPVPTAVRVAAWADRMARLPSGERFYSRSFAVDPLGTARAVLELRDELVEAGWVGARVVDGGARLDALAELELEGSPPPPGDADRLAAAAGAVEKAAVPYAELRLTEPEELWPACWRRLFAALARKGTLLRMASRDLPGAAPETDLGRIQAALNGRCPSPTPKLAGDGSFVVLAAETSWEAARATAAVASTFPTEQLVIIRGQEASTLDHALAVQGLRLQGRTSRSPWRAATQVLPLALELAFEPKDPYRVLELLTLSIGPFQGVVGHRLARTLAQSPGVRSPAWEREKRDFEANATVEGSAQRVEEWLESPGADPVAGAPKPDLMAVVERVRRWVAYRIKATPDEPTLLAAAGHASALSATFENDPRSTLTLVDVRRLTESVLSPGAGMDLADERAGRIEHVVSPGSLQLPSDTVLWWSFVDDGGNRSPRRWRTQEQAALARAGVALLEPRLALSARAEGWRRAIQAATKRVVLVVPRTSAGKRLAPHPLWDEIAATAGIDPETHARLTLEGKHLLADSVTGRLLPAPTRDLVEGPVLPGGHPEWQLPEGERPSLQRFSATSLSALLGCPLGWALGYGAGLRGGGHALPRIHQLNGTLGHRLVECLHEQGAFELAGGAELEERAGIILEDLIRREGAVLLRPGMAFERAQLQSQLVRSVRELWQTLKAADLRIVATELQVEATLHDKTYQGRLDLLVATETGVQAILDLKWGYSHYRELLQAGQALQLAFYGFAYRASSNQELPEVAYFSLSRGRLLALRSGLWPEVHTPEAPSIADTWRTVERSFSAAERVVGAGRLPISGLRRSLPLLEAFGVAPAEHDAHYSLKPGDACEYCEFDALCGRRWEPAS